MSTQEHTTAIDSKTLVHQYPITYVNDVFQVSQLDWAAVTKEAYMIYMTVKKLSLYLTDNDFTL